MTEVEAEKTGSGVVDETTGLTPEGNDAIEKAMRAAMDLPAADKDNDDVPDEPHAEDEPDGSEDAEDDSATDDSEPEDSEEDAEDDSTDDDDAPDVSEIDAKTLNAAKSAGLSAEQIASMSPEGLEALRTMRSREGKAYSEAGRQKQRIEELEAEIAAQETKADPEEPDGDAPDDVEFKAEDWGEEEAKRLNSLSARAKATEEKYNRLESFVKQEEQRRQAEYLDNFFAGVDKETYPDFGEGKYSEMPEDAPEFQARAGVVEKAIQMVEGAASAKVELDFGQALQDAMILSSPDATAKAARRKLKQKVGKRSQQVGARPTARRSAKPKKTPEEKANAALDAWGERNPESKHMLVPDSY